jgi:peptidoglycan-N-acetylmuramic acid deacetylase
MLRGFSHYSAFTVVALAALVTPLATLAGSAANFSQAPASCTKPVYLTFDTGHMGVAPLIADVLNKHQIKATFFLANERTKTGGHSLDDQWAKWWQARAQEGHAFGSHTLDHVYWLADTAKGFRVKASQGPSSGVVQEWTTAAYCDAAKQSAQRWLQLTNLPLPQSAGKTLFRAPGGKTSPKLLAVLESCGYRHIGWSPAGFLGDELPSGAYPNSALLQKALRDIRAGDILMAHLGIWSRQDPWAPAVLEPLIEGLKTRGFCFETLADKPGLTRP